MCTRLRVYLTGSGSFVFSWDRLSSRVGRYYMQIQQRRRYTCILCWLYMGVASWGITRGVGFYAVDYYSGSLGRDKMYFSGKRRYIHVATERKRDRVIPRDDKFRVISVIGSSPVDLLLWFFCEHTCSYIFCSVCTFPVYDASIRNLRSPASLSCRAPSSLPRAPSSLRDLLCPSSAPF